MFLNIILTIVGFALLIKGADFLVDGSSKVAKKFHISEIIIGLTIVSIGTSMPEMVVSVQSAIEGHSDMALGNIIGSNLANLLFILGLCAIIKPLEFKKQTRLIENPITIIVTCILFIMCKFGIEQSLISRVEGIVLLVLCLLFIIYNIFMAKRGRKFDNDTTEEPEKKISMGKSLGSILIGIIALKFGGDLVVENASEIATIMGISEKMISLTVVAFSTSLPELITSVIATIKGETDMAIGNVLGSQIFNILLIIGVSATLSPINYSMVYDNDFYLLIVGSMLMSIFPFVGLKDKMSRSNGIIFMAMYVIYMVSLVYNNLAI